MERTIFALGFFDGVHLGHIALLNRCRELAREEGCGSGAVTFGLHPQQLLQGEGPGLIATPVDRLRLLAERVDTVVMLPFDETLRRCPPEVFLDRLCRKYGAAGFVCGEDFRFGYQGRGDAGFVRDYCCRKGLVSAVVEEQILDGIRISSTYIRKQLQQGDMATAVAFLGHPYILTETVVPGKQLGRKLGFPTANLLLPEELAVPKLGVYACSCRIEGKDYPAVTNIGVRPTVSGEGITVEAWILDYSGDLYDREITLSFYRFLRQEEKFPTLEALQQQIRRDAELTRQLSFC